MKNVITLGGSSSSNSINKKLAEYAGSLLTKDSTEDIRVNNLDLNHYNLPLYSIDLETASGFPSDLMLLDKELIASDGIILSLAEHNGAYTAAFKNAFDWLSRVEAKLWRGKPMLLLSTSPGPRGGQSVMEIALSRFPFHNGNVVASMSFPSFGTNFKEGEVIEPALKNELVHAVQTFKNSL